MQMLACLRTLQAIGGKTEVYVLMYPKIPLRNVSRQPKGKHSSLARRFVYIPHICSSRARLMFWGSSKDGCVVFEMSVRMFSRRGANEKTCVKKGRGRGRGKGKIWTGSFWKEGALQWYL